MTHTTKHIRLWQSVVYQVCQHKYTDLQERTKKVIAFTYAGDEIMPGLLTALDMTKKDLHLYNTRKINLDLTDHETNKEGLLKDKLKTQDKHTISRR